MRLNKAILILDQKYILLAKIRAWNHKSVKASEKYASTLLEQGEESITAYVSLKFNNCASDPFASFQSYTSARTNYPLYQLKHRRNATETVTSIYLSRTDFSKPHSSCRNAPLSKQMIYKNTSPPLPILRDIITSNMKTLIKNSVQHSQQLIKH